MHRSVVSVSTGLGALHLASFLGRTDIVTLLLQRGCDRTLTRRVYTSAVVNDPDQQQPQLMNSSNFRQASNPVFFVFGVVLTNPQ